MIKVNLMPRILTTIFAFLAILSNYSCTSPVQCDQGPEISVDQATLATQVAEIDAYLESENITAQTHPSGIRFVELEAGVGNSPNYCAGFVADYEGRIMGSDDIFISDIDGEFSMRADQLAAGFKIAVHEMNRGADYRFFIPGVLLINRGISNSQPANIPDGENIEFRIRLTSY